jgi:predicted dehydrogenase
MNEKMRFVVFGGGSMGRRRIRCLLHHGVPASNIRIVDPRPDRRADCYRLHGIEGLANVGQALEWKPDAIIVATPTRFHMEYCLAAARAGIDFFCEIALSDSLDNTAELASLVRQRKLVTALGIQTPYHPVIQRAKQWLAEPATGRPLIYHFEWGNLLSNWHPWERYQDFYDPTQFQAVLSEEIGQLCSLLDDRFVEIVFRSSHLSDLEITGGDCFQLLGRTGKGVTVTLQLDLIQDLLHNVYRIVCEKGVIEIRLFPDCHVRRYLNATHMTEECRAPKFYQYEQCYLDEFGAFLKSLQDRTPFHHPVFTGIHALKCLEAARRSHEEGRICLVEA